MQLANVLDDTMLHRWIGIASERIHEQDWTGVKGESSLYKLLDLPQDRLLTTMCRLRQEHLLQNGQVASYVHKLAIRLHAALSSSLVNSQGELTLYTGSLPPLLVAAWIGRSFVGLRLSLFV